MARISGRGRKSTEKPAAEQARKLPGAVAMTVKTPPLLVSTDRPPMPALPVRRQFLLAWNRNVWMVMAGMIVSALHTVRLEGGVDGCRVTRKGAIDIGSLKSNLERNGWNIIPTSAGPGGSYIREVETDPTGQARKPRRTYISAWETAFAGSRKTRTDTKGYAKWLRGLVKSGMIPDCPAIVAEREAKRARDRAIKLQSFVQSGKTAAAPALETALETAKIWEAYAAKFDPSASDELDPELAAREVPSTPATVELTDG